jgi:hypothetical protein
MATLKNTTINDTGFLTLPNGTTAQRPTSPSAGQVRFNTSINEIEVYNGSNWEIKSLIPSATSNAGYTTEYNQGGYRYRAHIFNGTGTLTVTRTGLIEYLIVAGGGAGGRHHGGGGGGGGVLHGYTLVTPQTYTIVVGSGGSPTPGTGSTPNGQGGSGTNSTAFGLTSFGGGGGGNYVDNGANGGSGGGSNNWVARTGGTGTSGQGFNGASNTNTNNSLGAGGGAGSPGGQGEAGNRGGDGRPFNITGMNVYYAGGGGSGIYDDGGGRPNLGTNGFAGFGSGGYGNRSFHGAGRVAKNGGQNSGGGGGGNPEHTASGGFGGSGIVVVRYKIGVSTTFNPPTISNKELVLHLDASDINSYYGRNTWFDLSGYENHGDMNNNTSGANWTGFYGGTILFNGQNRVTINNSNSVKMNGNQPYTGISWIYPLGGGGTWHGVFSKGNAQQWALTYNRPNSYLHYETNQGGVGALNSPNGSVPVNQWSQVVSMYDGTQKRIYINGNLSITQVAGTLSNADNNEELRIGEGNNGELMIGHIAIVQIYRRALPDEEIRQNFESYRQRFNV